MARAPVVWRAVYTDPHGRERSQTFKRKAEAERWVTAKEAEKAAGKWVDPNAGKVRLGDWADQYMAARFDLKPKTRLSYDSLLRTCIKPGFGELPLHAIKPPLVE